MILPIKHMVDWGLLRNWKQMQINKYNIHKNIKSVDHDYKVEDKVIFTNNDDFKYEISCNDPFWDNAVLDQWNGCITEWCNKKMYDIRRIEPYTFDTKVGNIKCWIICMTIVNIWVTRYLLLFIFIKAWNKVYNQIWTGVLV